MTEAEALKRLRGNGRNSEVAAIIEGIAAERDRLRLDLADARAVNVHMRELIDAAGGIVKLEAMLLESRK